MFAVCEGMGRTDRVPVSGAFHCERARPWSTLWRENGSGFAGGRCYGRGGTCHVERAASAASDGHPAERVGWGDGVAE